MALEQRLVHKQLQKMVLSPQMRQALKVLQLPLIELRQLVHQELIQNPALEEGEQLDELNQEPAIEDKDEGPENLIEEMQKIAESQQLWDEYMRELSHATATEFDEEKETYKRNLVSVKPNLQEHLLRQLHLSDCREQNIGELIIGNIDEEGYLRSSVEEIAENAGASQEKVQRVLKLIQTFDPAGTGARDLTECLLIQLRAIGKENSVVARIVSGHLSEITNKRYEAIARSLGLKVEDVKEAQKVLKSLDPKPGYKFGQVHPDYIIPDIHVKNIGEEQRVVVNDDGLPSLRISSFYRELLKGNPSEETRQYLTEKFKSASWLIKSISQRKDTVRRVAECIVRKQSDFFEKGPSGLKPLRLKDVSGELNLHESTVSRVTTDKYMETERGILELKYFFSGAFRKNEGELTSARSIKSKLAQLIKNENPEKPLSDKQIAELIREDGTNIARRTVAKYRKQLSLLPAHLRKRD